MVSESMDCASKSVGLCFRELPPQEVRKKLETCVNGDEAGRRVKKWGILCKKTGILFLVLCTGQSVGRSVGRSLWLDLCTGRSVGRSVGRSPRCDLCTGRSVGRSVGRFRRFIYWSVGRSVGRSLRCDLCTGRSVGRSVASGLRTRRSVGCVGRSLGLSVPPFDVHVGRSVGRCLHSLRLLSFHCS